MAKQLVQNAAQLLLAINVTTAQKKQMKTNLRGDVMLIPCFEYCYVRFGKQYEPERCDDICDYAQKCLENKELKARLQIENICSECKDWKYERLWIGYKFCPYCGRVLDN